MPGMVREHKGYRIAIYSPSDHFAVITPPDSNRVIDLEDRQPRSTVVEGPLVCLKRAETLVDSFSQAGDSLPEQHRVRSVHEGRTSYEDTTR